MTTLPDAVAALTRCLTKAAALHPDHGTRLIVAVRATDLVVLIAHAARPAPVTLDPTTLIPRQETPR